MGVTKDNTAERQSNQEKPTKPSLSEAHTDNLSLYSPEEELGQLQLVAEKCGFPIKIIEIKDEQHGLGYAVFPHNAEQQAQIIAGAPWIVMDFDDTIGRSSMTKVRAREKLISQLGLDEDIIKFCDKIARCSFSDQHGAQYYAELEMRLLTFAHEKKLDNSTESKQRIEGYLQFLLTQHHSVMGRSYTMLL